VALRAEPDGNRLAARLVIEGSGDRTRMRLRWQGTELLMGGPPEADVVLLRLPAPPGATWTAGPEIRGAVLPDERIAVPAGTFDCVVVRLAREGATETYWIAPGVGFVRIVQSRGGVREEAVLARWSPGPARP
jgi:hypothetical protein